MTLTAEERDRLRAMFVEYRRTNDRKLRNELIEAHKPLASHLARRFANRGEPFDDLLQVAYLGMLKAVERFDPERGLEFSTFATATVEGELKRHFRDKTWSVRVPRRPQELHLRLKSYDQRALATTDARAQGSRSRGPSSGSAKTKCSKQWKSAARTARRPSTRARPRDRKLTALERRLGEPDHNFDLAEHRVLLERVLADLPERERTIVELRFFHEMTQTEIAEEVGISQMHVSRLLTRTLLQLRELLQSLDA